MPTSSTPTPSIGSLLNPLRGMRSQQRSQSSPETSTPTSSSYLDVPRSAMHTRAPSPYSSSLEFGPRSAPMVSGTAVKENYSPGESTKSSRRRFQVFSSGPRNDESFLVMDGVKPATRKQSSSLVSQPVKGSSKRLVKKRPRDTVERDFLQAPPRPERTYSDTVVDLRPQPVAPQHPSAAPLDMPMSPSSGTTVSARRSGASGHGSTPMFFTFEGVDNSSREPEFRCTTEDKYYMGS